jgi:UDP-N-acetylmuramoyl-tripeptide--D-alanyl-D-alanine ligase
MKLPLWRIAEFAAAKGHFDSEAVATGYSIDAHRLNPGDLFIALEADEHDLAVALSEEKQAVAAIVRKETKVAADPKRLLLVDDPLRALQSLGAAARRLWGKPLLAVAGSVGKTRTKEILAHLLMIRYRVLKSSGQPNNHIGLPLQLLRLEPEHDLAVVEMAMNQPGEICALGMLAHHDLAIVTCVAPAAAENARAQYEVIETLHPGGVAVLNADDDYVCQFGRDFHGKVVTFGLRHPADVYAHNLRSDDVLNFDLVVEGIREPVTLSLTGEHDIHNALAATAAALERGITPSQAAAALQNLRI